MSTPPGPNANATLRNPAPWVVDELTLAQTRSGTPVDVPFRGNFQPIVGRRSQFPTSGKRQEEEVHLWRRAKPADFLDFRAEEQFGAVGASDVLYDGKRWRVVHVRDWTGNIPHQYVVLRRVQEDMDEPPDAPSTPPNGASVPLLLDDDGHLILDDDAPLNVDGGT